MRGFRGALTKEEAMYAIIGLAVYAYGREAAEETEEVRALALRTRTLARRTEDERRGVHERIWPQLVVNQREGLLDNACVSLPEDLRMAAFAHAADVTFADRKVVQIEDLAGFGPNFECCVGHDPFLCRGVAMRHRWGE